MERIEKIIEENNIEEVIEGDLEFLEGFLFDTEELTESKILYDIDDMVAISLVERNAKTYLIVPTGCCTGTVYQIKDANLIEEIKDIIEDLDE